MQIEYCYDTVGNKVSRFVPGPVVYASWSYDPNNRPVVMNVLRETDVFVTYAYDSLGRVLNRQLGSGVNSTSVYDPAGRLSVLEHLTSAAGVNAVYTGTYDPAGNRLTQAELDGTITTFAYDNSYQLVHEIRSGAHPYNITYSYDPLGNRLSMVSSNVATTYSYNGANELVLTVPHTGQPTTTSYDANGNTALDNAGGALTTYLWDPENRLLSLRAPMAWTTATYSADGKRQSYASHNASGGFSALCDWRDEWLENHFIAGGSPDYFAMPGDWGPILQSQGGAPTYYLYDMLHNTRIATTLAATQTIVYTAFGPVVFDSFSGGTPLRKFQGEMGYDMDLSNLNYARNRYVDPAKGRWISRDPIGYDGGDWNNYVYAGNNPIWLVDPTGLSFCSGYTPPYQRDPETRVVDPYSELKKALTAKNSTIKANCGNCDPVDCKTCGPTCANNLDQEGYPEITTTCTAGCDDCGTEFDCGCVPTQCADLQAYGVKFLNLNDKNGNLVVGTAAEAMDQLRERWKTERNLSIPPNVWWKIDPAAECSGCGYHYNVYTKPFVRRPGFRIQFIGTVLCCPVCADTLTALVMKFKCRPRYWSDPH